MSSAGEVEELEGSVGRSAQVYGALPASVAALVRLAFPADAAEVLERKLAEPELEEELTPEEIEAEEARVRMAESADRAMKVASGVVTKRVTVLISPSPQGRVTGWDVVCEQHGAMEVLAPGRDAAVAAGAKHLELLHGARGDVKVKGRARRRGRRG